LVEWRERGKKKKQALLPTKYRKSYPRDLGRHTWRLTPEGCTFIWRCWGDDETMVFIKLPTLMSQPCHLFYPASGSMIVTSLLCYSAYCGYDQYLREEERFIWAHCLLPHPVGRSGREWQLRWAETLA
jgi:hypothetical protein